MNLTTPALLFPAISLLFLSYNSRFLALAALIRELKGAYQKDKDPVTLQQIQNLRLRLKLILTMELLGVLSFVFCVFSMLLLFLEMDLPAQINFGIALILLMLSLLVAAWEIKISIKALEIDLSQIQK